MAFMILRVAALSTPVSSSRVDSGTTGPDPRPATNLRRQLRSCDGDQRQWSNRRHFWYLRPGRWKTYSQACRALGKWHRDGYLPKCPSPVVEYADGNQLTM